MFGASPQQGNLVSILFDQTMAVVGVLQDDTDPMVSVMKLERAPTETYADIGGLEAQIQEIKVSSFLFTWRNLLNSL